MIHLSNAHYKLDIMPRFGARWIRLQAKINGSWQDILWPPPTVRRLEKNPFFGGAFLMAPWCNRIPNARFRFKREGFQLAPNFPDGSAIHGDVLWRPWQVSASSPTSAVFSLNSRHVPAFNFPFDFRFAHKIKLNGPKIEATLTASNAGYEAAPIGLGFHPFFLKRLTDKGTSALITVPGSRYYPSQHAIPTGPAKAVFGRHDIRTAVSLTNSIFDTGYTGLQTRPASLYYPDEKFSLWLSISADIKHMYVWSPGFFEGRPAPFVCIEPMSMSCNGLERREQRAWDSGVQILQPKERFAISWTIETGHRLPRVIN